uniref:Odorant receptor n=1 Tax=Timema cristinae TaxID=61476 RepID=A0A7R9D4A0_TIMCR|nr:unnamed protein product [Timema cristinae]
MSVKFTGSLGMRLHLLWVAGVRPGEDSGLPYHCFTLLMMATMITMGASLMVQACLSWGDIDAVTEISFPLMAGIQILSKMLLIRWRRAAFVRLLERLGGIETDDCRRYCESLIARADSLGWKQGVVYSGSIFLTGLFWSASPLVAGLIGQPQPLPLKSWTPFDATVSPYYEMMYGFQILFLYFCCIGHSSGNLIFYELIRRGCQGFVMTNILLRNVAERAKERLDRDAKIMNLGERSKKIHHEEPRHRHPKSPDVANRIDDLQLLHGSVAVENEEIQREDVISGDEIGLEIKMYECLVECSQLHDRTISFVSDMDSFLNKALLIDFLSRIGVICQCGFQIIMDITHVSRVFKSLFFFLIGVEDLLIYCWLGNELIYQVNYDIKVWLHETASHRQSAEQCSLDDPSASVRCDAVSCNHLHLKTWISFHRKKKCGADPYLSPSIMNGCGSEEFRFDSETGEVFKHLIVERQDPTYNVNVNTGENKVKEDETTVKKKVFRVPKKFLARVTDTMTKWDDPIESDVKVLLEEKSEGKHFRIPRKFLAPEPELLTNPKIASAKMEKGIEEVTKTNNFRIPSTHLDFRPGLLQDIENEFKTTLKESELPHFPYSDPLMLPMKFTKSIDPKPDSEGHKIGPTVCNTVTETCGNTAYLTGNDNCVLELSESKVNALWEGRGTVIKKTGDQVVQNVEYIVHEKEEDEITVGKSVYTNELREERFTLSEPRRGVPVDSNNTWIKVRTIDVSDGEISVEDMDEGIKKHQPLVSFMLPSVEVSITVPPTLVSLYSFLMLSAFSAVLRASALMPSFSSIGSQLKKVEGLKLLILPLLIVFPFVTMLACSLADIFLHVRSHQDDQPRDSDLRCPLRSLAYSIWPSYREDKYSHRIIRFQDQMKTQHCDYNNRMSFP